ncbi:MAG: hypothetical protein GY953_56150, partial [bacterium]|nr:hypothetical protein [bacterium]
VFPIPADGTKELRIGYVERLSAVPEDLFTLRYQLPMKFPQPVDDFSCNVIYDGEGKVAIDAPGGIDFEKGKAGQHHAKAAAVDLDGALQIECGRPRDGQAFADSGPNNQVSFYACGVFPDDLVAGERPKPKTVRLLWDASASARKANRQKKLYKLLEEYFKKLGDVKVELTLLGFEPSPGGEFQIKDGDWEVLRNQLSRIHYDGSSNFSPLELPAPESTTTILVTDGKVPRSDWNLESTGGLTFLINSGSTELPAAAVALAEESGGRAIGLDAGSDALFAAPPTLLRLTAGSGAGDVEIAYDPDAERPVFHIFGMFPGGVRDR